MMMRQDGLEQDFLAMLYDFLTDDTVHHVAMTDGGPTIFQAIGNATDWVLDCDDPREKEAGRPSRWQVDPRDSWICRQMFEGTMHLAMGWNAHRHCPGPSLIGAWLGIMCVYLDEGGIFCEMEGGRIVQDKKIYPGDRRFRSG